MRLRLIRPRLRLLATRRRTRHIAHSAIVVRHVWTVVLLCRTIHVRRIWPRNRSIVRRIRAVRRSVLVSTRGTVPLVHTATVLVYCTFRSIALWRPWPRNVRTVRVRIATEIHLSIATISVRIATAIRLRIAATIGIRIAATVHAIHGWNCSAIGGVRTIVRPLRTFCLNRSVAEAWG